MNPPGLAPGSGPSADPPTPREPTLGDLLVSALSAEMARENNRRTLERVAARSSVEAALLSVQIAAYNSGDRWGHIPAALAIRAYTNREFGMDFTPEAVRRVRGRVCEALDIDTAAADALPLKRVAEVLAEPRRSDDTSVADTVSDFRWLKVTQAARVFALTPSRVTKLADQGTFITNGKIGYERRVDALSLIKWVLDRVDRPDDPGDESA